MSIIIFNLLFIMIADHIDSNEPQFQKPVEILINFKIYNFINFKLYQ